jgi:hypothetical protein
MRGIFGELDNEELNRLTNGDCIVKFIKTQWIRWLGHVERMEVGAMPRRMLGGRLLREEEK